MDYPNNNTKIKYNHRNLITEFTRQDLTQELPITDVTKYKYDEAGNRTRKTVFLSEEYDPPPFPEEEADLPPGWTIIVDDYYSRDVAGREIMVYSSYTLQYWNVWSGNEITGRINYAGNSKYYYLKDHLGSVRAVLDEGKTVISANDYDMWGYYLENRAYNTTNTKNKFTGKERDNESTYDYFGARYYDSRVGRWGQMEPAINNLISYSPYSYCILNPLKLADYGGNFPRITISGNSIKLQYYFYFVSVQSDPVSGLDAIQANVAKELIENMKTWSGSFSILGVDFNINVDASLKEFGNTSFNFMEANISKDAQYYNFVMQANEIEDAQLHQGVGISGDYLKLSKGNKLKP